MVNSFPSACLPHTLQTAHEHLCAELRQGIESFKLNLRFSNAHEICRAVERFVHQLSKVSAWFEELQRRSCLVELRTAPEGDYDQAKQQSLASYRGRPRKLSRSKLAIGELRSFEANPEFLSVVISERDALEQMLDEGVLNLSEAAEGTFRQWLNECGSIQREAESLNVDGARFLYHVYQAVQPMPSNASTCAKSMVDTGSLGGGTLEWTPALQKNQHIPAAA